MSNFTDRYMAVPIQLYNSKESDITGKEAHECENIQTYAKINPFDIEYYRPGIIDELEFEEKNMEITSVYFRSGESLTVFMDIISFEKQLNNFGN